MNVAQRDVGVDGIIRVGMRSCPFRQHKILMQGGQRSVIIPVEVLLFPSATYSFEAAGHPNPRSRRNIRQYGHKGHKQRHTECLHPTVRMHPYNLMS